MTAGSRPEALAEPAGARPGWVWAAAIAGVLFLVACLFAYGGLLSHARPGDTSVYAKYGRALLHDGRIPYRDFYDEYPPGSVPVFALPAIIWNAHYVLVFKLLMTACGLGFTICAAWTCRPPRNQTARFPNPRCPVASAVSRQSRCLRLSRACATASVAPPSED